MELLVLKDTCERRVQLEHDFKRFNSVFTD